MAWVKLCMCCVFLFMAFQPVITKNSYLLSFPNLIRPGMPLRMSVHILSARQSVSVKASLVNRHRQILQFSRGRFNKGNPGILSLMIPAHIPRSRYTIKVEGYGGLRFRKSTHVTCRMNEAVLLIRTDKAVYSQNQKVRMDVVALKPNLMPLKHPLNIHIFNAGKKLIQQWIGITPKLGVVSVKMDIGDDPVFGTWQIKVSTSSRTSRAVKHITVRHYVKPKFDVKIYAPTFFKRGRNIVVKVEAKYVFGKNVNGAAKLRVVADGRKEVIRPMAKDINRGVATFTIRGGSIPYNAETLELHGQVGETTTGTTVSAHKTIRKETKPKPKFVMQPPNFKPGLIYKAYIGIDGELKRDTKVQMTVRYRILRLLYCSHTRSRYVKRQWRNPAYIRGTLRPNGIETFSFRPPLHAIEMRMTVRVNGETERRTTYALHSPTKSFIAVHPRHPVARAGRTMLFDVVSSRRMHGPVVYQVVARGSLVFTGSVDGRGKSSALISLRVRNRFVPAMTLLVHHVTKRGEVLGDKINIGVQGNPFKNKVTIRSSEKVVKPGKKIKLSVSALPKSVVHVLAVDESVKILQSGFDLSILDVINKIKTFGKAPYGRISKRNLDKQVEKRSYISADRESDAEDIFEVSGMNMLTDANVYDYDRIDRRKYPTTCKAPVRRPNHGQHMFLSFSIGSMQTQSVKKISSVSRRPSNVPRGPSNAPRRPSNDKRGMSKTRKHFPDTWLWIPVDVGHNGVYSFVRPVPDTITTWSVTAFATNTNHGFGMVEKPEKIMVEKDIFMIVSLPRVIKRGEQFVLKVSVFNYMKRFNWLMLMVSHTDNPSNTVVDNAELMPDQSTIKYIYLKTKGIGDFKVKVVARNMRFQPVDVVEKSFTIKAEGLPQEYNIPLPISLFKGRSYNRRVRIKFPPNVVKDSQKVSVQVFGDTFAPCIPSLTGLHSLIKLPTGCGEQTMLRMAPNIFILKYLAASRQLTKQIRSKAVSYMNRGRDNELRYQRNDGSFSVWGNRDRSGSTWLTAFVARSFHQAKEFIKIEDNILNRAMKWLLKQKNRDGSFREPGRVIHTNMQGGSAANKVAITAYTLIALLENKRNRENKARIAESARRAIQFLERKSPNLVGDYALAIASYALTLGRSGMAKVVFQKLLRNSIVKDKTRHWEAEGRRSRYRVRHWGQPNRRACPIDIETTAYALLTYTANGDVNGGLPVLKWLTSQRNPDGGYASTQDTVVSLHAMAEFSALVARRKQMLATGGNLRIQFDDGFDTLSDPFIINSVNKQLIQKAALSDKTRTVKVNAVGTGLAIADIIVKYNIRSMLDRSAFKVVSKITKETLDRITVNICTRWLRSGKSGFAIVEIGLPSGFNADLSSINKVRHLKNKATDLDKAVLYFDEIDRRNVCFNMSAYRVSRVSQSQKSSIVVYEYYNPNNQGYGEYTSGILKNLTLCKICKECKVCRHQVIFG